VKTVEIGRFENRAIDDAVLSEGLAGEIRWEGSGCWWRRGARASRPLGKVARPGDEAARNVRPIASPDAGDDDLLVRRRDRSRRGLSP